MAWADADAEIAHVDELIDRVRIARDEARGHNSTALIEADDARMNELLELRHLLVEAREPVE